MKHPSDEQWVEFLYGDGNSENHSDLHEHLQSCRACRSQLEQWESVKTRMDLWTLPSENVNPSCPEPNRQIPAWIAQSIAASLLVAIGFVVGTYWSQEVVLDRVRAEVGSIIESQITSVNDSRESVFQRAVAYTNDAIGEAQLAGQLVDQTNRDQHEWLEQLADAQLALRRDIESLAIHAEREIKQTQSYLNEVAGLAQKASSSFE